VLEADFAPDLIQQAGCRNRFRMRRYGIHFLGSTKKVQPTDDYQITTFTGVLYSIFDGLFPVI
jgi:hypothetical protein